MRIEVKKALDESAQLKKKMDDERRIKEEEHAAWKHQRMMQEQFERQKREEEKLIAKEKALAKQKQLEELKEKWVAATSSKGNKSKDKTNVVSNQVDQDDDLDNIVSENLQDMEKENMYNSDDEPSGAISDDRVSGKREINTEDLEVSVKKQRMDSSSNPYDNLFGSDDDDDS